MSDRWSGAPFSARTGRYRSGRGVSGTYWLLVLRAVERVEGGVAVGIGAAGQVTASGAAQVVHAATGWPRCSPALEMDGGRGGRSRWSNIWTTGRASSAWARWSVLTEVLPIRHAGARGIAIGLLAGQGSTSVITGEAPRGRIVDESTGSLPQAGRLDDGAARLVAVGDGLGGVRHDVKGRAAGVFDVLRGLVVAGGGGQPGRFDEGMGAVVCVVAARNVGVGCIRGAAIGVGIERTVRIGVVGDALQVRRLNPVDVGEQVAAERLLDPVGEVFLRSDRVRLGNGAWRRRDAACQVSPDGCRFQVDSTQVPAGQVR